MRIIVLGVRGSGKSAVLQRLAGRSQSELVSCGHTAGLGVLQYQSELGRAELREIETGGIDPASRQLSVDGGRTGVLFPAFSQGTEHCILLLDLSRPMDRQIEHLRYLQRLANWEQQAGRTTQSVVFHLIATKSDAALSGARERVSAVAEELGIPSRNVSVCSAQVDESSVFRNIMQNVFAQSRRTVRVAEEKKPDPGINPDATINRETFNNIVLSYESQSWVYKLFKCFGVKKYRSNVIQTLADYANKPDAGDVKYSEVENLIKNAKDDHRFKLFTKPGEEKTNSTATDRVVGELRKSFLQKKL